MCVKAYRHAHTWDMLGLLSLVCGHTRLHIHEGIFKLSLRCVKAYTPAHSRGNFLYVSRLTRIHVHNMILMFVFHVCEGLHAYTITRGSWHFLVVCEQKGKLTRLLSAPHLDHIAQGNGKPFPCDVPTWLAPLYPKMSMVSVCMNESWVSIDSKQESETRSV